MFRKRSSIISIKSLSQISTRPYPFFYFQRFRFSISPLRSEDSPDLDHIGSDSPDLHNTNCRTAQLSHLNDFQNLGGTPHGFTDKRSSILPTPYPIKFDKENYFNGNVAPKESFDFSKKIVNNSRYSENLQQSFEGYRGTNSFSKSSTEGSRSSGQCTNLNSFQKLGRDSNESLKEMHDNAYDLRNSMKTQTHQGNSQSTNYMKEGHKFGNQNVGNGVYEERCNFSLNAQHNVSNQHQSYVFDARSSTVLKQNVNGHQTSNHVSDFDNKNIFAENFQSTGVRIGSEFCPVNNVRIAKDNQRTVSSQYANVSGLYPPNHNGPYSTNLQQNSNGYIHQFNANGIHRENSNSHSSHLNDVVSGNGDQFNHWNNGQNMIANQQGAYERNSVSTHNSSSYGYQRNIIGEAQQWKHGGFCKEYQNGHMNNTHIYGSTLATQYNHTNNVQTLYNGLPRNNIGQVQQTGYSNNYQQYNFSVSGNLNSNNEYQNHYRNSVGELKRDGSINISKELGVGDGHPYSGANGIFRSNIMLNQESYKTYIPSSEQIGQVLSDNMLTETVEIISFEDCMYKLDAFCAEGKVKEAVATLAVLEKIGMCIDVSSYLKLLKVCGKAKTLDNAKIVHAHLSSALDDVDVSVHNEIIDMYSKCGSMADAKKLFLNPIEKNNTTWEKMITGLANNNLGEEAIDLYNEFKKAGLKPDVSLFNALFYTCGILSAVDQGLFYFKSMRVDYGISPTMENYASIVDMLGRSGHLDEALEFIESLPIESNVDLWFTLMNYCRINGYFELGNQCAEIVDQFDSSKLTDDCRKGLLSLKSLELFKENEFQSDNDNDNQKHQTNEYMAGRTSDHVMNEHMRCLAHQSKETGYVPDIACMPYDVDPENREEALMFHSERLATVHAFMITPPRRDVRILNNFRACNDCHNFMKIVSKFTGRKIIARDSKRFHHFSNGKCSCNDFW